MVEGGGRLVANDQPRPVDQGAGERDALLLAAGQHARQGLRAMAESEAAEHFGGAGDRGLVFHAGGEQGHGGILRGGERGQQVVLLEDEAEIPPAEEDLFARREGGEVLAEERDAALVRGQQPGDDGDEGGLPAAGRADEEGHLAARGLEVDAAQHLDAGFAVAEGLADPAATYGVHGS